MAQTLPAPEILRSEFEEAFTYNLQALRLRWNTAGLGDRERLWELPEGVMLCGPAPQRFGVHVQRLAADGYAVRLLWDRSCFYWPSLRRVQLLSSAIGPLLAAVGKDLRALLDQPIQSPSAASRRLAA
jgi:hypothetical protein